jgi:soluble lytic murein transglycosylase-like protein
MPVNTRLLLPAACAALLVFALSADCSYAESRKSPAARRFADAPLRESAAWREGVAQLESYRQGTGQAPAPLRVNAFAPAGPSVRASSLPVATARPDPRSPVLGGGADGAGPIPQTGQTGPTPDWEKITLLAGSKHGVDADLIKAILQVESNFNSRAVSPKGALGAMQIMPATARELGLTNFFDPVANIDAGTRYLAAMLQLFPSLELSLAAYNAGPGAVRSYGAIPPYSETRTYVSRVLDVYKKLSSSSSKSR